LLPLTGVFAFSAPLGGVMTEKLGPRIPLAVGMVLLGIAMIGLHSLAVDSGYSDLWPWFLLIGIALGLVVVASSEAIVGNAPVERGGVAGGLQSTANQLGGVLGTAILGSVLASKVGSTLPHAIKVHGVTGSAAKQLLAGKPYVSQGLAPKLHGVGASARAHVVAASNEAFMNGLHAALLVAAIVAFAGVLIALVVKRGVNSGAGAVAI
jgi:MFS family permease